MEEYICPYCNCPLAVFPARKKKCEGCGNFIYVRTKPITREKILIREDQIAEIEKQWEEYLDSPIRARNMNPKINILPKLIQLKEREKQNNVKFKVIILVMGGENACEHCRKQEGMEFMVNEALEKMPLPHKDCTHKYGCRCTYITKMVRSEY